MHENRIDGNTDTGMLKIIAIICMIIDHTGARILPYVTELRIIGRIAFPLYVWCMVVGAEYTKDPVRYALRLLLAGVIAQPFYMLGLHHTWKQGNVMFTLLLGFLAVTGIRVNRYGSRWWAPLAALVCTSFVTVDYGMNGVWLAILLYLCRERRGAIAAVMVVFCMYWGATSSVVNGIFGYRWNGKESLVGAVMNLAPVKPFLRLQALAVLAMPLMVIRRKKRTPLPRAVAYAAYPGHLLILWLVQLLMEKTTLATAQKLLIPWL